MEQPDERMANAGDGDPLAHPAEVQDGTTASPQAAKEEPAPELDEIDLDALFGVMGEEFGFGDADIKPLAGTGTNGDGGDNHGEGEAVKEQVQGGDNSTDVAMRDSTQDMDDEYDELFDDPTPIKDPITPAPSIRTQTPPELDVPTVMSNITTLKSAIISNHLLLTRFLHLQSAYRSLATTFAHERRLHTQTQSTITRMREEMDSLSHDSPLLQFQVTQLKEDVRKERATRTQSEATIAEHWETIKELRTEVDKLKREKTRTDLAGKRSKEALKEIDSLKMRVVGYMSEKNRLERQIKQLEEREVVLENERLQEEIVRLKERVNQLEGSNIRLKAGRSILMGGEGNTLADMQTSSSPVHTHPVVSNSAAAAGSQSTSADSPAATPPSTEPINISDDEVVYMGAKNIASTLRDFQLVTPTKTRFPVDASRLPDSGSPTREFHTATTPTPQAPPARSEGNKMDVGSVGEVSVAAPATLPPAAPDSPKA